MSNNDLSPSLIKNPLISQWVSFETPGSVRVGSGKVEIGQGILTAFLQIAAEELDVNVDQIQLVSGHTAISPDEGTTSGSYSISVGGAALRLVCAETRELFVSKFAEINGCAIEDVIVEGGKFSSRGRFAGEDYWTLSPLVALDRKVTGMALTKRPSSYRVVGRSLPRTDLQEKLAGKGLIHDLAPQGCKHARVLHQPWWDAQLADLDEARLRKAVAGAFDIIRDVNFVAFVADTEFVVVQALQAARSLAVWHGGRQLAPDIGQSDWLKAQHQEETVTDTAGSEAACSGAGDAIKMVFYRPFLTYASIGPSCGLAQFTEGRLTVWSHTQSPMPLRNWVADLLDLDRSTVTVVHVPGAGAYGHNTADDAAFEAALIAVRLKGPVVKVIWSREDEFTCAPLSAAMRVELTATLNGDGRPSDWTTEIWSPPHAQRPGMNGNANLLSHYALSSAPKRNPVKDTPLQAAGGATRNAIPIYDFYKHRLVHHMLPDIPLRTSSLRSLGAWFNVYAIESFVDELAGRAGVDPVDFRLSMLSDPRAKAVVARVAELSRWFDRHDLPSGSALGLGFARYKYKAAYCAVVTELELDQDVRLKHIWCVADPGLVINPDGVRNQLEGGIIQGASFTLREKIKFDRGKVATEHWDDYPVLRFSDIPEIEIDIISSANDPAVGVGEVALGPVAASISNAVARALGVRVNTAPINRDNILFAVNSQ